MQVKLFPDTNSSKEPNWCIWKLCLNGARIKNQHTNRLAVCLLETVLKMTKGPKSRFKEMSQVKLCPCSRQALQSKFDAELMSEQARSVPFLH